MRFIGDIHGKYEECAKIKHEAEKSIQVGDFGWGFRDVPDNLFRETDRYILGNHDDPVLGRANKNNHLESGLEWEGIFPINGAMSIDRHYRIEGVSWWEREEHTNEEFYEILGKWETSKCDIVVAHDCPESFIPYVNQKSHHLYENSKTRQVLSSLIYIRKPKIFIFGHHHISIDDVKEDVRYICLPEIGFIDI